MVVFEQQTDANEDHYAMPLPLWYQYVVILVA
jgi:hypothetical protein